MFIAIEVSIHLKVDVFEATSDPLVQLHVCEGSSPKRGDFTSIFGAKIDNNFFFQFFQYFTVKYQKRIFLYVFSILFGKILHIFVHKV